MSLSSELIQEFAAHYNHWITIFLMVAGLFVVISRGNMIKKLVGLSLFQTSVYLLYISPGKIIGGTAPILDDKFTLYSNPLPHVLILTAIVVGIATLALGLAIVVRINEEYGTIEEDEIFESDELVPESSLVEILSEVSDSPATASDASGTAGKSDKTAAGNGR